MKKLLLITTSLILAVSLQAEVKIFGLTHTNGANATNLITGPIKLLSLTLLNGDVGGTKFVFFDSPATNATHGPAQGADLVSYSNGLYYTYGVSNYTIVRAITNFSGLITNETRTGIYTYAVTNIAATNSYPIVFSGYLGAGVGTEVQLLVPYLSLPKYFGRGLTLTNTAGVTNATIIVEYYPAL